MLLALGAASSGTGSIRSCPAAGPGRCEGDRAAGYKVLAPTLRTAD
jgi:hypothetical protein